MMGKLSGKVAIITGGARNIGAAFAKGFAAEGAKISIADIEPADSVVQTIRKAGGEAMSQICDISDPKAVSELVRSTDKAFGAVDILVNNAALAERLTLKPFEEISSEEWDRVFAINVRGAFECIKAAAPVMRRKGYGKIINMASTMALTGGMTYMMHYMATKGALIAMTRGMAHALGKDGIRVNAIAPGLTVTESV